MTKLPNWPALIAAPAVALANASIAYALVTPSCAHQDGMPLHGVALASLMLCVLFIMPAALNWRRYRAAPPDGAEAAPGRRLLLAQAATLAGALSALVVLAEWLPQWILPPCGA